MIKINVLGLPSTQGNKTPRPFQRKDGSLGATMTEGKTKKAQEHLHSWRGVIAAAASLVIQENGSSLLCGPVIVEVTFYLPRAKNAKKKLFPDTRPDLDKLQRAVGDALSGIAYVDDSRIVDWHPRKRFADQWGHGRPGAAITVRAAEASDV